MSIPLPQPQPVEAIKLLVARRFGIPLREMNSPRRNWAVAHPRQVAMYLARRHTTRSYPELARLFGRLDHSTIIHGCRAVEERRKADPRLDAAIAELEGLL